MEKLLAPNSLVLITHKKLPQAFANPERVFYAKQWFLFLKSSQVYLADWFCLLVASITLVCTLMTYYQQLPIKELTTPQFTIQPYNPKSIP